MVAEAVRFELTDPCESAVFKTAGLNRSPKPPQAAYSTQGMGREISSEDTGGEAVGLMVQAIAFFNLGHR